MALPDSLLSLADQAETDKADLTTKAQAKADADRTVIMATQDAADAAAAKEQATAKLANTRDQFIALINTLYGPQP